MNLGLTYLAQNVGMSLPDIILFIVVIGCIILMAKDFRIGIMLMFIFSLVLFMWFYNMHDVVNWAYERALISSFLSLVFLALTLIPSNKSAQNPFL
jgi:hypothetical protein